VEWQEKITALSTARDWRADDSNRKRSSLGLRPLQPQESIAFTCQRRESASSSASYKSASACSLPSLCRSDKNTVVGDAFEHTDLRDPAIASPAVMDRVFAGIDQRFQNCLEAQNALSRIRRNDLEPQSQSSGVGGVNISKRRRLSAHLRPRARSDCRFNHRLRPPRRILPSLAALKLMPLGAHARR
jgi:hypothetical protein